MSESHALADLNEALRGRYRLEREIGEGGMATVYLATDLRHDRNVAVKVLKPEFAEKVGARRFLAEIKTTASLLHPHILPLFDSDAVASFLFFVMPYVDGGSLRERIDREHTLPVDEAIDIVRRVAGALHHAHERGFVHRDVKPANVMLLDGEPMMADFGIALALEQVGDSRLTTSSGWVGTPRYMSPEQATGDRPVDARSDVYSLACLLYELLTGEPPHIAKSTHAMVAKRLTEAPTPVRKLRSTVPEHVESVLAQALQVEPVDRYESAEAFARALAEAPSKAEVQSTGQERVRPSEPVARAATPFVGRSKEVSELFARLDDTVQGRGSFMLIGGEPGVGKTRLAEFVMEEARARGCMCVVGRAYELSGTPPFTPFVEQLEYTARVVDPELFRTVLGDSAPEIARVMPSLRQHFDDIGAGIDLPADQVRHYLFHRYREFVERACQVRPLVALFDNLHWADEGSLLLIEHLVQHVHELPFLGIGTYREAELEVKRPFAGTLERLVRQHSVHRLALKRLSRQEVGELFGALGGSPPPGKLVDIVSRGTEGNPFFAQEVFRHLDETGSLFDEAGAWRVDLAPDELDVPESVRLVVGRRLERVGEDCRTALTTASVIGRRFALSVLEGAGDFDEDRLLDVLEEAESAQLIQPVPGSRDPVYQFTHALIRQTLIETLSIPRRQRHHVKIAEAFRSAYRSRLDEHASEMAYHLYQAGAAADPDETLRFLRLAGDQALARFGFEDALAQYERALSLEEDVPPEMVPVLLEGKVHALDGTGRWKEVIEIGQRALGLYEEIGDRQAMARLAYLVCLRLTWRAAYRRAVDVGTRILDALEDSPSADRAKLRSQVGSILDLLEEPGAREVIDQGLTEARASGDDRAVLRAMLVLREWHYHHSDFAGAQRVGEEALRAVGGETDPSARAEFLWMWALILPLLGRLDEAEPAIEEARKAGQERNEVGAELCAHFGDITVTGMRTADGRRIEALSEELAQGSRWPGGWARGGHVWAGLGRLWQGDAAGAAALMGVDDAGIREPRLWNALSGGWRFRTAAYAGLEEARALYEAVEGHIYRAGRRAYPGDGFGLHAVIEGLVVLGDLDAAGALYEDAVASLETGIVGHMDGLWECTTGLAAAAAERWDDAERHFAAALRQAEDLPHVMAQCDTRRWWGWMLLRRGGKGDRERAGELLREAVAGYQRLSAPLFEKIATDLLTSAGG